MTDLVDAAPCEHLSWDSAYWGFPVARVLGDSLTRERVAAIDHWCEANAIACLYFLATFDDPTTVRCAEDAGFRLVDMRVSAVLTAERFALFVPPTPRPGLIVRPAMAADLPALQRMASDSYLTTRFYFDPHFPRDKCAALYAHWITESFRGQADQVLVVEFAGAPAGYTTLHLPTSDAAARVSLLNTAPDARRRGVAKELLRAGFAWFALHDVHEFVGVTQARNMAVQGFNSQIGFVTQSCGLWYHKWYRVPGSLTS